VAAAEQEVRAACLDPFAWAVSAWRLSRLGGRAEPLGLALSALLILGLNRPEINHSEREEPQ